MRRIVTAITALSLAFSLVAMATPANAAVAGYDSAYAGESAFLQLAPGQSGTFTVFFANTGSTSWVKGSASQVDLAACLDDKVTCNAQDATEAPFNSGWLSATRYATHTQTTVAPGQIGTFTYNVMVPAAQAAGTYRFNGALVLAATGADIRNEGYYQDVTVGGTSGAASITSLTPNNGTNAGGTNVVIAGSGIVCTPAFPTVTFGTTNGTVTSCGATSVTATSPAGAVGTVNVTVTNPGAGPSNALTYTYTDTTAPQYTSLAVAGNQATVTFSEAVCRNAAWAGTDWEVTVNGVVVTYEDTTDFIPACDAEFDNGVTSATILLAQPAPNGSFVAVTLTAPGGAKLRDTAGNTATSPRSNTTTATNPETTAPTIASSTGTQGGTGANSIKVTFSEPVYCTGLSADTTDFTLTDNNAGTVDPTVTGFGTDVCGATQGTADTSFQLNTSGPLLAGVQYSLTITPEANELQDVAGNDLATSSSTVFTTGPADFTPPTLTDTRVAATVGSTDIGQAGDSFTITFSEAMAATTTGDTITFTDNDGTVVTLVCTTGLTGTANEATCVYNTGNTVLTVALLEDVTVFAQNGTIPGSQLPSTITSTSGIRDASNNAPNLAGSADRVIDIE